MANPAPAEASGSDLSESVIHSRPSRIHFPAATSHSQPGHASGAFHKASPFVSGAQTSPLRLNRNGSSMNGRRRVRSVDAADVPLGTPRPHRTPVHNFVTPSRRRNAEARLREDNSGFGTFSNDFSNEYDLCELCNIL